MKLTPFQLMMLAVGGFATVIMVDILAKYQNDAGFRQHMSVLANNPAELLAIRTKRVAEENMESAGVAVSEDNELDDNDDEG